MIGGVNIKTLYVVGNGFDIAHGLETSYWKMREYIYERDPSFLNSFELLYNIQPLDDTEPWYTKEAQERWNKSVNHNLWSAFEYHMGNPNTTEMLELSTSVTEGMPSVGIRYHMDFYWKEHFEFINKLEMHVSGWIETVNTENIEPLNQSLINSTDFFFNFNYTDILEKAYGIEKVLHIHGGVTSVCDINPIMGHCNNADIMKHRSWAKEADAEYAEAEASIQDAVANYLDTIYKNPKNQIAFYKEFFDRLSIVNRVVIIGWSIGEVDLPYLHEIIERVSHNTQWTVYWYDDDDYKSLKNVFEKVGIKDKNIITFSQAHKFWDLT